MENKQSAKLYKICCPLYKRRNEKSIYSFVEKKSSKGKLETNWLFGGSRNEVEKTEEMNGGEEGGWY